MPKARSKENSGLPRGWRLKHGAYYFRVPPDLKKYWDNKTEFQLGASLANALSPTAV
jgi:hypothetical protein